MGGDERQSYITDFFISFYSTQIEPPKLVDGAALRLAWNEQVANVGDPRQRPDIIAVLEESTFDPTMLEACKQALCKRKMFKSDARTRATGYLQVHTWGGGTWTSEFAFLTSMAHILFGNAGLYAPRSASPRVEFSLPRVLKENGLPLDRDLSDVRQLHQRAQRLPATTVSTASTTARTTGCRGSDRLRPPQGVRPHLRAGARRASRYAAVRLHAHAAPAQPAHDAAVAAAVAVQQGAMAHSSSIRG